MSETAKPKRPDSNPWAPKPPKKPRDPKNPFVCLDEEATDLYSDEGMATAVGGCAMPGVEVGIVEAPLLAMLFTAAGAAFTLHAMGRPGGGAYQWTPLHPAVAGFPHGNDPGNVANLTGEVVAPGNATFRVTYTTANGAASAQVIVRLVTVAIQGQLAMLMHAAGGNPNQLPLQAVGEPAPGTGVYAWTVGNAAVASFQGGNNPGNQAVATFESVSGGTTAVTVDYTLGTIVATANATIQVVSVVIAEGASIAVLLRDANHAATSLQLNAVGTPGGGNYTWLPPAHVAAIHGSSTNPAVTLNMLAAGSEQITVQYVAHGQTATATIAVHVVDVVITQGAAAVLFPGANVAAATLQLDAVGTPGGGNFTWPPPQQGALQIQGASDGATVTFATMAAGTEPITVQYVVHGETATATIDVHVVAVTITQGASVPVLRRDANNAPSTLQLDAVGTPANGNYTWMPPPGVAQVQGSSTNAAVTLATLAGGTEQVTVQYQLLGQTATAVIDVHVIDVTITQGPLAAVLLRGANNAATTLQLDAVGTPANGTYSWPPPQVVAQIQGGNTNATVTLGATAGGSEAIAVQYLAHGLTATALIDVHVVDVTITQGAAAAVLLRGVNNAAMTLQLDAVGTPANGTYAWTPPQNVAQVPGATNNAAVILAATAAGTEQITVQYSVHGQDATAVIDVHVVDVTITQGAAAAVIFPGAGNPAVQVALNAVGTPANGTFTWPALPGAIVQFQGGAPPVNLNAATLDTVAPGTEQVTVQYDVQGQTASAVIAVSVVGVVIQEGAHAGIWRAAGGGAGTVTLHAVGTPGGGAPTWQALNPGGVAQYAGAVATVAALNATLQEVAAGETVARVRYLFGGATASATTRVHVQRFACSRVDWTPHAVHANRVAQQPVGACVHGPPPPSRQRPQSGIHATVAPAQNHHHGTGDGVNFDGCHHCSQAGESVDHWIEPFGAAVVDLAALIGQLQAYRTALVNGVGGPALAGLHAWLANVPANLYTIGGGQGKMVGVLRGVHPNGNAYRLRAVSGRFAWLTAAAPDWGVPNAYWSRPRRNPLDIYSASSGVRNYFGQANLGPTFGKCAASSLLAHALLLNLRVDSMAEAWFGDTVHGRVEGQLQNSCDQCRRYFEHMLCDRGNQNRGAPPFTRANNAAGHPGVPNRGF